MKVSNTENEANTKTLSNTEKVTVQAGHQLTELLSLSRTATFQRVFGKNSWISQFVNFFANTANCGGVCNLGTCSKKSRTEATPFTQTFPFCEPHLKGDHIPPIRTVGRLPSHQ